MAAVSYRVLACDTCDSLVGVPAEGESRNVLVESARIARSEVKPLTQLTSGAADAVFSREGLELPRTCVILPVRHRSDFAVKGADMTVNNEVERVIKDFHGAKKPIGLCCIAPVLAARVLGGSGVTLTLGQPDDGSGKWPYGGAIEAAKSMGAKVVDKSVGEIVVDAENKVVTTPAFMYNGKFHEIHDGVAKAITALLGLVKIVSSYPYHAVPPDRSATDVCTASIVISSAYLESLTSKLYLSWSGCPRCVHSIVCQGKDVRRVLQNTIAALPVTPTSREDNQGLTGRPTICRGRKWLGAKHFIGSSLWSGNICQES
ncbi:ES1, mitochondrial [Chionoecetes opilio]|uniref:ES1, mitochondrial n=1 Tax=Chionoecetes opilio TaxID=41210 RepID=A0A8J4YEA0_CHIOP|nr:ES1, mitochondrial [Chionoecetes opilio]